MSSYQNSECEAHTNVRTNEPVCPICMHAEIESLRAERDALLAKIARVEQAVDRCEKLATVWNDRPRDEFEHGLSEGYDSAANELREALADPVSAAQANEQEQADER